MDESPTYRTSITRADHNYQWHRPKTASPKRENSPAPEAEAASNIRSLHPA